MGKTYGYARVSTVQQSLEMQIEALENYGIASDDIFSDKKTGKNMERQSLKELLSKVEEGDIIIVNKLDRLGRSVSQVTGLVDDLTKRGIYIKSIEDGVDTSKNDAMSNAMLHLLAMFSEMERNFIVERTKPAIANAKEKGVKFGRPVSNKDLYKKAVKEYVDSNGEKTVPELIKEYGKNSETGKPNLTQTSFYRHLAKYKEENGLI